MADKAVKFDWALNGQARLRQGRYGPVFQAINIDSGVLLCAERLEQVSDSQKEAISLASSCTERFAIKVLGYQQKDGNTYLLSEAVHGGTLHDLIQSYGPLPLTLVSNILRELVQGIHHLHGHQGLAVIEVNADHIWMDHHGKPKIEGTVKGSVPGQPHDPELLTLPEKIFGQGQDQNKIDVWLLGIIAARMISGQVDLVADDASAAAFGAQIKEKQKSPVELLLGEDLPKDPQALDFLQRCLAEDVNERWSVSKLRDHPFLVVQAR